MKLLRIEILVGLIAISIALLVGNRQMARASSGFHAVPEPGSAVDAQYFTASPTPTTTVPLTTTVHITSTIATPTSSPSPTPTTGQSGRFVFGSSSPGSSGTPAATATSEPAATVASTSAASRFQFSTSTPAPGQRPNGTATALAENAASDVDEDSVSYFENREESISLESLLDPVATADARATETGQRRTTSSAMLGTNLSNYEAFVTVEDRAGRYSVEVPAPWAETRWRLWTLSNRNVGVSLIATSDLSAFDAGWTVPGMSLGILTDASLQLSPSELLNSINAWRDCTYNSRYPYSSDSYTGSYDIWTDCGGTDAILLALAAEPTDEAMPAVMLRVKVLYDADVEAFEQIIASFGPGEQFMPLAAQAQSSGGASTDSAGPSTDSATDSVTGSVTDDANEDSAEDGDAAIRLRVASLNMRAGPGVTYDEMAVVREDDAMELVGQSGQCAWLQVRLSNGTLGWITGGEQYVQRSVPCSSVPEIAPANPPPTPEAPDAEPDRIAQNVEQSLNSATGSSEGEPSASNNSDDEPPFQSQNVPAGQACLTFQEQVGAEVTATFTYQGGDWSTTFVLPRRGEHTQCFEPGEYTYTFDAPPPRGDVNGRFTLEPGEQRSFPVLVE